ncbi:MAG: bifunctional serine/threonine-protein kinase/formylglycine-generating enzyme family protein [Planctomycetota bacterium]
MVERSPDPFERLRRACELVYLHRTVPKVSDAELMDSHPDLSDLLGPMLLRETAMDSPMEHRVGGYRIVREVGRGGMGIVYEAIQVSLGRRVALKVMAPHHAADSRALARFHREARTASRLAHSNIIEILEIGSDDERSWIAMELVDGEAIGSGSVAEVVARFTSICDALEHAHRHGVIHRDLKPSNILVRRDGSAVLTDFGIAREIGSPTVTRTGEFAGTPAYVAPEQVRGERCDPRTDVYGVGAALYEVLTGRPPFDATTVDKTLLMIVEDDPVPAHEISRAVPTDLSAIVARAMEKDPADRYASAAELGADLRAFLAGGRVRARPAGGWRRISRWVRREPMLAMSTFAIMLLLAGGLGLSISFAMRDARALEEIRRLSDARMVSELVLEPAELWPPTPDRIPRIDAWLAAVAGVAARRDVHSRTLASLESGIGAGSPEPVVSWQVGVLRDILGGLDRLEADGRDVQRRRAFAVTVDDVTLRSPEARQAWDDAARDVRSSGRYGKLELRPIRGLLPLGLDPHSRLMEFWHVWSGDRPKRDPVSGNWSMQAETGIVLVLVPGARFAMGAERPGGARPAGSPNADLAASHNEQPVHDVELAPFLIGKYEVTQAQWLRHTRSNPSVWQRSEDVGGETVDASHPVERITAEQADRVAREMDLMLPTEAQWECAARAGTTTVFYSGNEVASLQGYENIADATFQRAIPSRRASPEVDDGRFVHAAVGSYRPNGFGLHDMLGNVAELCADALRKYSIPVRPGDGMRIDPGNRDPQRAVRGGSHAVPGFLARCAVRTAIEPTACHDSIGVRFARGLDP